MKKLLMTLLASMMLVACDNTPVFHGLTQQEKEAYAQSIKGEYPGRYAIAYTDRQATGNDTTLFRKNVSDVTLSISDLTMHTVIFNNFPLSLIAHVVDDPELGQALSTLPDMGLTGNYEFMNDAENGMVGWYFDMNPVALSLNYGSQQHNIVLHFGAPSGYITLQKGQIESGTAFVQDQQLTLELTAIYEGEHLLQQFNDVWTDDQERLLAVFRFGL